ncbi:hypothetical protein [Alicyclobacillus sp. SO9]|uniref:hypothetical protein n=1 Tax=Alicyclobacillus sp. SO9 TaxID=2665646 RepID=UPI0018E74E0A|nr:hypothetical protein [Alicyclobacillus sp. SO9]
MAGMGYVVLKVQMRVRFRHVNLNDGDNLGPKPDMDFRLYQLQLLTGLATSVLSALSVIAS